jgi:hypothetical protein
MSIVVLVKSTRGERRVAKLCDLGWAKVWSDPSGKQTLHVGAPRYWSKVGSDCYDFAAQADIH